MIQKLFIYVWSAIGAMHRYACPLGLLRLRHNTTSPLYYDRHINICDRMRCHVEIAQKKLGVQYCLRLLLKKER